MRKKGLPYLAALLLALLMTGCRKEEEPATLFLNVRVVPMTEEMVLQNRAVLVEGKRIAAVGFSGEVAVPDHAVIINGEGAYLIPGLADMHMHTRDNWFDGTWPVSPLALYLAHGVTTLRDFGAIGEDPRFVLRWRDEIARGEREGPTLYSCGPILGGPLALSKLFSTEDPREIISRLKETGYDFTKLYSHLSGDQFKALTVSAREAGMYTAGHIPFSVGLEGVLAAGMDEIAHVEELDWELYDFDRTRSLSPPEWDKYIFLETMGPQAKAFHFDIDRFVREKRDSIRRTVENLRLAGIPLDTTLVVSAVLVEKLLSPQRFLARPELVYLPETYLEAFSRGEEKHQRIAALLGEGYEGLAAFKYAMDLMWLGELKRSGIPLLLGSDAGAGAMGLVPGFSLHEELRILTENGFTPYEAIAAGTVNASKMMEKMIGRDDFGTIEEGKRADFILVKGNPLEDVALLSRPLGVMANGRWYSREDLAKMTAWDGRF